ncbi:MAG: hypothetical protein MUF30_10060, partial [Burkholderiales bacterium]|nr:hypothetical protein [Burkholderiales bacterium]
ADLPGGRNGPLDAYRHTLASAVVAWSIGERPVAWVTAVMEWRGKDANTMDRHNNRIGARIGRRVQSFAEIEPTVRQQVREGAVGARAPEQTTWLPRDAWGDAWLW